MQINMKHMHKIMTFTVIIFCNSMEAFACTKDPKYHQRTKYINIQYHYIRDMLVQK